MRRLREAGRIVGYRLDGRGRTFFYRVSDVNALMVPALATAKTEAVEPAEVAECADARDYAERNLRLLTKGRAA
jgi:hypothetical protein